MRADLDRHLAVETLEEVEQLVGGEAAEMPVHQVGDFRLLDAEQGGDLPLRELLVGEQFIDVKAHLRPGQQLVGVVKPRSAKTLPEPSSRSISLWPLSLVLLMFRQLLRLFVSLFDIVI